MRHVTIAERSFLVGNAVADLLVEYAVMLGRVHSADSVIVRSIGLNGNEVEADFLLNSGTVMMVESSASTLPEPDNSDAQAYLEDRLRFYGVSSLPVEAPDEVD